MQTGCGVMVIEAYAAWAVTAFNIALWLLTLAHRRLSPLAKAYFGWTFFVTLWSFGYGITLSGWLDYEPTLLWNRWCQAMATLIGPLFFRFSTLVAGEGPQYRRYYHGLLLTGLAIAAGVMFSPLFVKGLWSFGAYRYQPLGGPLYAVFTGFFWCCSLLGFWILTRKWRHSAGTQRAQIRVVWLGSLISFTGGAGLFFQGFGLAIPSYGIYPLLAYVVLIGYAVHRYHFMDVELLVRRTVLFTGLSLTVLGIVGLVSLWLPDRAMALLGISLGPFWPRLMSVLLIVLLFDRVRGFLLEATDRVLFQKRYDPAALLARFTEEILTIVNLRQLGARTVAALTDAMKLTGCMLFLRNPNSGVYRIEAHQGLEPQNPMLDATIAASLQEHRQPLATDAADGVAELPPVVRERMNAEGLRLILPLILHDDVVGAVTLGGKKSDASFTAEDLAALKPLAASLAIAISNARLFSDLARTQEEVLVQENRANTDALTGTLTRRAFLDRAERSLQRAARQNDSLSIVMADLDHFKQVNDTHGHLTGDVVLQEVATRLGRTLREDDLIGRYGGEEFVLLLAHIGGDTARSVAERLRSAVADGPVQANEASAEQTVSLGVATYPDHAEDLKGLIARADAALYEAKRTGRNTVVTTGAAPA